MPLVSYNKSSVIIEYLLPIIFEVCARRVKCFLDDVRIKVNVFESEIIQVYGAMRCHSAGDP